MIPSRYGGECGMQRNGWEQLLRLLLRWRGKGRCALLPLLSVGDVLVVVVIVCGWYRRWSIGCHYDFSLNCKSRIVADYQIRMQQLAYFHFDGPQIPLPHFRLPHFRYRHCRALAHLSNVTSFLSRRWACSSYPRPSFVVV